MNAITKLFAQTNQRQIRGINTMANSSGVICNLFGKRDAYYGTEYGHDKKNEVRNERWIRKTYRRSGGESWRESKGYDKVTPLLGSLRTMSNWSDVESGLPGTPLKVQAVQRQRMTQLAQDIYDAAMLVRRAKGFSDKDSKY